MDQHTTRESALPGALWAVIGAFAVVAACLLYPTMVLLRLATAFFSASPALGLLGLAVALVVGSFVVAFARVGYGLYEGSRVARGIAFVLAGYLLLACFAMPVATGLTVVLALASLGAVAVLAATPAVRAWFAGPWAQRTELPTSIVVAQTVVLYSSGITALLAGTLLVSGVALLGAPYEVSGAGLMIVGALLCAGIAGVGFWARSAIGRGERTARVLTSAATAADLVVILLLSSADENVLPLLASFGLHAAVVIALWLPADARRFFGGSALPAVENLQRQVLEIGLAPASPMTVGPPSGRHARPDITAPATTTPAGPAFCGRCGSGAVPGAAHCVRCGSRRLGRGAPEPRP